MAIDESKFPVTRHISDDSILAAIWHREDDGFSHTRSPALADRLHEAGELSGQETGVPAIHRELERRMLALSRAKKLQHDGGNYALVDPDENARYSLVVGGEKGRYPIDVAPFPATEADVWKLAEVLSDLTGFRTEYLVAVKLSAIQPGETATFGGSAAPIKFIITRRV